MLGFWKVLQGELFERIDHEMGQGDHHTARALRDVRQRAQWVELDLRDYGNDSEHTRLARRVYASWKSVYVDGVAREHLDEAEEQARMAERPF